MTKKFKIQFDYKNSDSYKKLLENEKVRKILAVGVIIIFFMFVFRVCFFKKEAPKAMPGKPVEVGEVIKKDTPIEIGSFGTLTPIEDVDIKSQVTGKIQSVNFKEGDYVENGDMLFTIDPSEYQAKLDEAIGLVEQDKADLKLQIDTLERNRTLVKKNLISQQDFEIYQTDVALAEAKLKTDQGSLEWAKINLDYCYIRSPIGGVTGKRLVDPGNIVTANSGSTLVNIKSVDPFYLDFTVSETDLVKVRNAMAKEKLKVEIYPENDDNAPYGGELIFIDNTVNELTGTIALRALIPNKERRLWAGQFVTVSLIIGIEKDATLAPYKAVAIGQKGPYLFIVTKEDKADLRLLKLGERYEDHIIIEDGVKPGEKFVVTGQLGLAPGVPVKITTPEETNQKKK